MEPSVSVKEVKILETAEDIQERREQGNILISRIFKKIITAIPHLT